MKKRDSLANVRTLLLSLGVMYTKERETRRFTLVTQGRTLA